MEDTFFTPLLGQKGMEIVTSPETRTYTFDPLVEHKYWVLEHELDVAVPVGAADPTCTNVLEIAIPPSEPVAWKHALAELLARSEATLAPSLAAACTPCLALKYREK